MQLTLQPQNSMGSVPGIWLIITGVGSLIHVFSVGYMHGD